MVIIGILTTTILAAKVTITTETLKLRKEASVDSAVIELLSQDEKYEVIEELEDWYKIKYKDTEGYISKEYAKIDENANVTVNTNTTVEENTTADNTTTNSTSETQTSEDNTAENKEMVILEDMDVRISPLINSCIIEKIKKDTEVKVITSVREWSYIDAGDYCGWIKTTKLDTKENVSAAKKAQEAKEAEEKAKAEKAAREQIYSSSKTMYVKSGSVNVRKDSTTNSDVITSVSGTKEITVKGELDDWYKVSVNGEEGYILKSLLTTTKPETTSRSTSVDRTAKASSSATTTETSASSTGSATGSQLVAKAKQYLGCKYVYGAAGPSTFDCSGFTMYIYKQYGISLPHTATGQSYKGTYVSRANLAPGDLVIINDRANSSIGHVGIYIGGNQMIHASSGSGKVIISSLSESYYNTRYNTARRIF